MNRKIRLTGITMLIGLTLATTSGRVSFAAEETQMVTVRSESHYYDQDGNETSGMETAMNLSRRSDSLLCSVPHGDDYNRKSLIKYREDGTRSVVSFTISEPLPSVSYLEYNAEDECLTQLYLDDSMMNLRLYEYEEDGNPNQYNETIHWYMGMAFDEPSIGEFLKNLARSDDSRILRNTYDMEGRLTEQVQLSEDGTEEQRRLITYEEAGDTVIRTITDEFGSGETQVTIQEKIPLSALPQETVSDDERMEGIWIGRVDGMREEFLQLDDPEDFLYSQTAFLIDTENSQCLWYDGGELLPVKWEQDGSGCIVLNEDTTDGEIFGEYVLQYDADTDTVVIRDLVDTTSQTLRLTRW